MSLLRKFFGGSERSVSAGSPAAGLRSLKERRLEREGNRPLSAADENAARNLCRLAAESREMGDEEFDEMQHIGEQLYARGGHVLMQRVCYRVRALGGSHTYVSTAWDGVGEWMD